MKTAVGKYRALFGLILGGALWIPAQASEVYKWVDEDGVTHYSQEPPPAADATRVDVDAPPEAEIEREREEMEETGERLEKNREQRREAEQAAEQEARDSERREQRCADLRASLEQLTENRRLLVPDGEGDVRRLPEEERQERVAERRRQIAANCE